MRELLPLVERLRTYAEVKTFRRRQPIYLKGDAAESLYILERGLVRVGHVDRDPEVTSLLLAPVSLFGDADLFCEGVRGDDALALTDAKIAVVGRDALSRLIATDPEVSLALIGDLARRSAVVNASLRAQAHRSAEERLAALFVELWEWTQQKTLPFTQEELSALVGVTRRSVSTLMSRWQTEGVLSRSADGYIVEQLPVLAALSTRTTAPLLHTGTSVSGYHATAR